MVNKINYIFSFVVFLIFSNYLFPQASLYKPFLKKPSWTVEYISWVSTSQTWVYQKDTLISSKNYQKIVEVTNASSPLVLREDSSLKTVYCYDLANSLEYVYADFNLIVGNTFLYSAMTGTVDIKDSVLISGQYHNHIRIRYGAGTDHIDWTEGLLSSYGPNSYYFQAVLCPVMKVNCMCKNNQNYYSIGGLCNLSCGVTKVWDANEMEDQISIAPNPGNGIFEINSSIELNGTIEVYDVTGRLIYRKVGKDNKINICSQATGIYSVVIKDEKGVLLRTTKVVKE